MHPGQWRTLRTLFDELIELDPSQRDQRLEEIGSGDPDLRGRLAALLSADERSSGEMRSTLQQHSFPSERVSADWLGYAGRRISHFQVIEALGSGGMGVVYRAEDTRLKRSVALKFPLPHTRLDPHARARFLREARSLAALDHPNLCTIYDVGETIDGYLFIAMPLYDGETLAARLARERALPVEDAVSIARHVAAGLARAHAAGVIHRDLKPANIMLLPDGTAKLLDFGLAQSGELSLSLPGTALGTVRYMAPEQLAGDRVDERADLWALGVILYQMITGRRPFEGSSDAVVAHSIRDELPAAPTSVRPELSAELNSCVLRLLEKDPDLRYSSADALLDDLPSGDRANGTRQTGAVQSRTPTWRGFLARWPSAIWAIGAVGVITAAAVSSSLRSSEPRPPASIAVLPFINLSPGADSDPLAAGLYDDVATQLAKMHSLRVFSRGALAPYIDGRETLDGVARTLGASTLLEGTFQHIEDGVRINLRLVDPTSGEVIWAETYDSDARGLLTLHQDIAIRIARELGVNLSGEERLAIARLPTDDPRALTAYYQGRFYSNQLTPADLRIALDAFDRAIALDSTFALAWAGKSEACVLAAIALVVPELESCFVAAETALELDDQLAAAHAVLGRARTLRWDWAAAEASFLRALELDPTSDFARQGYGVLLRMLERPEEAMTQFMLAAAQNPGNLFAITQVGWVFWDEHRNEEALAQYDAVIRRDPTFWLPLYNKGLVYTSLRDTVRLRETIEQVTPLTVEGAPHLQVLEAANLAIRGDSVGALRAAEQVCGARASGRCLLPQAGVLHVLGHDEEALSLLEVAAELRDPLLPNTLSEPGYDDLGAHPRLQALRRKVGVERR